MSDLALFLEIPRSTLAAWKKRKSIPIQHLAKLAGDYISINWLLTGEGSELVYRFDGTGVLDGEFEEISDEDLYITLEMVYKYMRDKASDGDEDALNFVKGLSKEKRHEILFVFLKTYGLVRKSRERWKKSNIVSGRDLYRALLVEYDVETPYGLEE